MAVESNSNFTRKAVEINVSGWKTHNLFKDFYVINEKKYIEDQKYVQIDVNQMTAQKLEYTCFAFDGINQVLKQCALSQL
jgi:hypothetical protein